MSEVQHLVAPNTDAMQPIPQGGLEVISIAKSYDKRAVLTDISLSVGKGEVLGLLGPNGAGKTTCFYSIMGLVRPDRAGSCWMGSISPICRCTAAPRWGWAICRRKPRSFGG
jgi:ABC-type uncharacterized transport system ATPase subunit